MLSDGHGNLPGESRGLLTRFSSSTPFPPFKAARERWGPIARYVTVIGTANGPYARPGMRGAPLARTGPGRSSVTAA
jgi:hypothetical protein